jgi:hypothetical protein
LIADVTDLVENRRCFRTGNVFLLSSVSYSKLRASSTAAPFKDLVQRHAMHANNRARLDAQTYERVEADQATTVAAVCVVVLASIAASIGIGVTDLRGLLGVTLGAMATWMVWVGLTYVIGTRILRQAALTASVSSSSGRATVSMSSHVQRPSHFGQRMNRSPLSKINSSLQQSEL